MVIFFRGLLDLQLKGGNFSSSISHFFPTHTHAYPPPTQQFMHDDDDDHDLLDDVVVVNWQLKQHEFV